MKTLSICAVPVTFKSKDNFKEERILLFLALSAAPFYMIVIPFLVFNHIRENVFFGIVLMTLSLGNLLYLLSWTNYYFAFSATRVKLPGWLRTTISYSRIKSIFRSKDYPLMVGVLFKPESRLFRKNEPDKQEILCWYSARNERDAKIIWSQFLERLEDSATRVTEDCISMGTED